MIDIATIGVGFDTSGLNAGERALNRTEQAANKMADAANKVSDAANKMADAADKIAERSRSASSASNMLARALHGLGLAAAAVATIRMADSVTELNNKLRLATGSNEAAARAYKGLYAAAQSSRVGFVELGNTYTAIARNSKDAGISADRLMTVTQAIGNAMTLSGGSAQSMQAALVQLGQGFASGTLRGEELNSVMEQTSRLAQAIADGMGITIDELRAMGQEGKLTSGEVIRALENQAAILRGEVATSTTSASKAATYFHNALTNTIATLDNATGASGALARAIISVGEAVEGLGGFIEANGPMITALFAAIGSSLVVAAIGKVVGALGVLKVALAGIAAFAAANPIALALIGIGAAVSGFIAYNNAAAKTTEGMEKRLRGLQNQLKEGPSIYARNSEGLAAWEKQSAKMRDEIGKLQADIAKAKGDPVTGSVGSGDDALARAQRAEWDKGAGARAEYMAGARSDLQKFNDEMAKAKAAFGGVVPPEVEANLRSRFIKPMKEASSATAKTKDEFAELYNSLRMKDVGLSPDFNENLNTLYKGYSAGRIGVDEYRAAVESLITTQKFATDAVKAESDARQQAADANNAEFDAAYDVIEKNRLATEGQIKTGREMLEQIQFETSLLGMNTEERERAIAMRELERAGVVAGTKAYEEYADAIEKGLGDKREKEKTLEFWKDFGQKGEDIFMDIAMNGEDAFKRIGKALEREVLQMLYRMIARQWIMKISGGYDIGGGSGGGYIDMAKKAYDYYNKGSKAASTMSAGGATTAGGGAATAATYGTTVGSQQTTMLAAQEAGMATSSAGAGGAAGGTSAMAYAGYAALIVAAFMHLKSLYEKGYNRSMLGYGEGTGTQTHTYGYGNTTKHTEAEINRGVGKRNSYTLVKPTQELLDALGMSKKYSDILSGTTMVAHALGRKLSGYGYDINMQGGQANVRGYESYKPGKIAQLGGSKTKTFYSDVTSKDVEFVRAQVEAIKESAKNMARATGQSTEAIDGYTGSLKINFKGAKTAEEQAERVAKAMDDLQYSMLKAASGGKLAREEFDKMREEATKMAESAGISTQSISDTLLNGMMGGLGAEQTGAQMADLIAGGIVRSLAQQYTNQIASMFMTQIITPIFTAMMAGVPISQAISQASIDGMMKYAQETARVLGEMLNSPEIKAIIGQISTLSNEIGQAFGGIKLPPIKGMAAYNAASQAASEAANERYTMETQLMTLLGMTDKLRARELNKISAGNRALQVRIWALEDAKEALEKAFSALQKSIEKELDTAKESEEKLKSLFDTLKDSINDLYGNVTDTAIMRADEAMRLIRAAAQSGKLPNEEDLRPWIDAATGGLEKRTYGSAADRDRATLRLAAELSKLKDTTSKQLSDAEAMVVALESQLETAQNQYNALLKIDESVLTVAAAQVAFNAAMKGYTAATAAGFAAVAGAATSAPGSGGGGGGGSGGGGGGGGSSGAWTAEGYWAKNPDIQKAFKDANLGANPLFNKDPALSAEHEYASWHWQTYGQKERRRFATGGAFTNGIASGPTSFNMGLMGEAGPEAIMPLANIGGSLGVRAQSDPELKELVRELIERVKGLESTNTSIAASAHSTDKQLKKVIRDEDGDPVLIIGRPNQKPLATS